MFSVSLRSLHTSLIIGLISLSLGVTLSACQTPELAITEVSFPSVSGDAEGPYVIQVTTKGVVEELSARWARSAPEGAPEAAQLDPQLNREGVTRAVFIETSSEGGEALWRVAIPGGAPIADYSFSLIAEGPSGEARFPRGAGEGEASFQVRALNGRCESDGGCLTGELCHRLEGYCFTPPEVCTSDVHCPRDRFCNVNTGLCRFYDSACEASAECAVGYRCVEGVCALPCEGRCGGGYVCEEERCVAPPCAESADCPAQLPLCEEGVCRPTPDRCEPACEAWEACVAGACEPAPCATDDECPEGRACFEGRCGLCSSDASCGDGFYCELSTGACLAGERGRLCAPCQEATSRGEGCGETLVCLSGYPGCRLPCERDFDCVEGFCDGGGCVEYNWEGCAGVSCWVDEDCGGFWSAEEPQVCLAGHCVEAERCEGDADCPAHLRCGGEGVCQERAPCERQWGDRCPSSEVCVAGQCEPARDPQVTSCEVCSSDLDCGAQQVCSAYLGVPTCFSLCDDGCADTDICEPISELESICVPDTYSCDALSCGWDVFEPNNNQDQATLLAEGVAYVEGWVCSNDQDWYEIDPALTLEGFFFYGDQEGIVVDFYDANGRVISTETPRPFDAVPLPSNTRWLAVSSPFVPFDAFYWLEQSFWQSECEPDLLEPNDSPDSPYAIGYGAELTLSLCLGDEDWFLVEVDGGFVTEVTLSRLDPTPSVWELRLASATDGSSESAIIDFEGGVIQRRFSRDDVAEISVRCVELCEDWGFTEYYELTVSRNRR